MQTHRRRVALATLPALIWPGAALPARSATAGPAPTLVTSELPPIAMPGKAGQRGVLVDLVEAMLVQAGMAAAPEFYPWARAMLLAQQRPRTLILPLNRTEERESSFQWLVKLYTQRFSFLTLAGRPRVERPEQLDQLRIASLRGSSNLDSLQRQGVQTSQIYAATSVADMQRALERGLVDALYGSELIHVDAWRRSGRDAGLLRSGLSLASADVWLAAQGGITDAEQARLQQAHEALLADGRVERLFRRYGLSYRP